MVRITELFYFMIMKLIYFTITEIYDMLNDLQIALLCNCIVFNYTQASYNKRIALLMQLYCYIGIML